MFYLITLQKIPPTEYETEDDRELEDSESELEDKDEKEEHQQPSSDYYIWSSCGTGSSDESPRDEDSDWTANTESTEDENTDVEMEDNSYNEVK